MPDDASREGSDSGDVHGSAGDGDQSDAAPWGETMLGSAGEGSDGTGEERDEESNDESTGGNVAGEFRPSENIEPGTPSLENSLFVVFGAYVAVLGLTRLFIDVQGFDAQDLLVLTGGTLLVGLVLFGFFGVLTPDT